MYLLSSHHSFWLGIVPAMVFMVTTNNAFANATSVVSQLKLPPITKPSGQSKVGQRLDHSLSLKGKQSAASSGVIANVVFSTFPENITQQLENMGLKVLAVSDRYHMVTVRIYNKTQLEQLTKLAEVKRISQERGYKVRSGDALSRAPEALKAAVLAQAPNGLTGKGIRIGIISDSFAHTTGVRNSNTTPDRCHSGTLQNAKNQLSGDLPKEIDLRDDDLAECDQSLTDEGAGMAELVHDMAPDAAISFHAVGSSLVSFANAIDDLCTPKSQGGAGANIVVDDIGFFNEPFYQEGIVAAAQQRCLKKGVMYLSAAGNDGDQSYQFTYNDYNPNSNVDPSSSKNQINDQDFHKWSNGSRFLIMNVPSGSHINAMLYWNQPFVTPQSKVTHFPQIDFDMYLFKQVSGTNQLSLVDYSQEVQGEGHYVNPEEIVQYNNTSSTTQQLYLAVSHWSGPTDYIPQNPTTPVKLSLLFAFTSSNVKFSLPFNGSNIYGHSGTNGIISVAAMPWYNTDTFAPQVFGEKNLKAENFTSRGNLKQPYYFSEDGQFMLTTHSTPTLTSVDGNNTTFFGQALDLNGGANEPDDYPNFFGTSAAAPNAAAVAALLMQYAGSNVPQTMIRQAMIQSAQDVIGSRGEKGQDAVTGAGLINANAALTQLKTVLGR